LSPCHQRSTSQPRIRDGQNGDDRRPMAAGLLRSGNDPEWIPRFNDGEDQIGLFFGFDDLDRERVLQERSERVIRPTHHGRSNA
jgi:hypothetical protein